MPADFGASVAASTIAITANKLLELASHGVGDLVDVNKNLRLLDMAAQRIQERLDKLDPQLMDVVRWKSWVQELTKMCYDIEDIIDSIKLASMRRRQRLTRPRNWLYRLLHRGPMRLPEDDQMLSEARKIILSKLTMWGLPRKISTLFRELENMEKAINLWPQSSLNHSRVQDDPNEILRLSDALALPQGRQSDKDNIVQKLLTEDVVGVSIVGMTGLGKTALARSILDDASLRHHFHIIWWGQAAGGLNNVRTREFRRAKARVHLSTRSLLVLDDLQDVSPRNMMAWEDIFRSKNLRSETNKTTLLITTRDPRVAWGTNTIPFYLKRMTDQDCKELISYRVYPALMSEVERNFFTRNASRIAQKCMGMPLVACVTAHTLCAQISRHGSAIGAISYFMGSDLWGLVGQEILQVLSFRNPGLRTSNKLLTYFSLFPREHVLNKDDLLQLWMAEGFIQLEKWTNWEQTANQHFDEMLPASMIEPSSINNEENHQDPSSFQVLEITRTIAQSIASNMCYSFDRGDDSDLPKDTRHISVCCQNFEDNISQNIAKRTQYLRTFILMHKYGTDIKRVPCCVFQKFLRVLDLSRSCITTVPGSIGKLKHLRYLDLSYTTIRLLPDATCKLYALRILKLKGCSQLQQLPKKFSNLVNLIHLDLTLTNLTSTPPKMGKLINLQTLHKFIVNENKGHRISELKHMNALQGSIKIVHLENVKDGSEAAMASLSLKSGLTRLELQWTESSMPESSAKTEISNATEILNELQPPINLAELQVTNYSGLSYPLWFYSQMFHNLQKIHLHHWPHCTELPPLWKLPVLTTLHLDSMCKLKHVDRHFFGDSQQEWRFGALEYLEVRNMEQLASWNRLEHGDMPCLKELRFVRCPWLTVMPTLHCLVSLKTLEITDCPRLKRNPNVPLSCDKFIFDS